MTSRPLILLHVALKSPRRTATNRAVLLTNEQQQQPPNPRHSHHSSPKKNRVRRRRALVLPPFFFIFIRGHSSTQLSFIITIVRHQTLKGDIPVATPINMPDCKFDVIVLFLPFCLPFHHTHCPFPHRQNQQQQQLWDTRQRTTT